MRHLKLAVACLGCTLDQREVLFAGQGLAGVGTQLIRCVLDASECLTWKDGILQECQLHSVIELCACHFSAEVNLIRPV